MSKQNASLKMDQEPVPHPAGKRGRSAASAEDVKTGDRVVVTVKQIGINGEGVGYYRRKAVFIQGVLPDEVVKARVTKVEPSYMQAELVQIEKKSSDRQKPACPVYEACGGCQLQHMTYPAQLRAKERLVQEAFERYTGLRNLPLKPIIGMDHPWGYRNKVQMQVGLKNGRVQMGLYVPGSHELVDISGCPIQDKSVNRVLDEVKVIVSELRIPIYQEKLHKGGLRTVVARIAQESGNVQLTLITACDDLPRKDELVARIRQRLPLVTSIAQNIHTSKTSLVFGEKTVMLWGQERLRERLSDVQFSLSPRAFFQLNPEQTVKLYDAVQEAAALTGRELVVDAYCGTGTITLAGAACEGSARHRSRPRGDRGRPAQRAPERCSRRQLLCRQGGDTAAGVDSRRLSPRRDRR